MIAIFIKYVLFCSHVHSNQYISFTDRCTDGHTVRRVFAVRTNVGLAHTHPQLLLPQFFLCYAQTRELGKITMLMM